MLYNYRKYNTFAVTGVAQSRVLKKIRLDHLKMKIGITVHNLPPSKSQTFQKYPWHRFSLMNRALFCDHMAQCFKASLSIQESIRSYKMPSKFLPPLKEMICAKIDQGSSFAEAIEISGILDDFGIGMLQSLEKCDAIHSCFEILAKTYYQQHHLKEKLKKLLTYPILLSFFLFGIFFFALPIFIRYVQAFLEVSESSLTFNNSLFVHLIHHNLWVYCGLAFLALKGIFYIFKPYKFFSYYKEKIILYVPVFGPLKKESHLHCFFQQLSHQLKAGIPLTAALIMQTNLSKSFVMQKKFEALSYDIAKGLCFSAAIKIHLRPPSFIMTLLEQGEATGMIEHAIEQSGRLLETSLVDRIEKAHQYIQPLFLIGIGLFLTWGVSSILYPLYEGLGNGLK